MCACACSFLESGGRCFLNEPFSSCSSPLVCVGRVTNLRRVTYVVLDEADRMFDMGFEPQVSVRCPLCVYFDSLPWTRSAPML